MSLTTRISLFFLAMLAAVLVCFSLGLYLTARWTLLKQVDERVLASLNILAAAVEIEPDGVEWNRGEHRLAALDDGLQWRVTAPQGLILDGTDGFAGLKRAVATGGDFEDVATISSPSDEQWRHARVRVIASDPATFPPAADLNSDGSTSVDDDEFPEYSELVIAAALPVSGVYELLQQLATWLAGLSVAIWLVVALLGGWLCRTALRPVRQMAAAAGRMGTDPEERLPTPRTQDELADLGRAFNGLLDRLQEAFERQRRFTGEASHQLRTPLTSLLGQIDVALRRERSSDEYRETLQKARGQTVRLQQIVESLLFLARSDAEGQLKPMDSIELGHWLQEYRHSRTGSARADDLQWELAGLVPCRVAAQDILLAQLLDNLIDNALKYSAPGSPVTIRLVCANERPQLEVCDRGIGIAAAERSRIFSPFFRAAEARRRGIQGVGLGLAIARRIADQFGAELQCDSRSDGGTCFRVVFPRQSTADEEPANAVGDRFADV